jgi:predicted dehydrogenase
VALKRKRRFEHALLTGSARFDMISVWGNTIAEPNHTSLSGFRKIEKIATIDMSLGVIWAITLNLNEKIGVVLLGCGAVSEVQYAPALNRLIAEEKIGSVSLIDRSKARIEVVRRILPHASTHTDLSEIIQELNGNLVIVALPNNLHASVTITALNAGAHVLCEKPMARTVAEGNLMLSAAAAADRLLAVGHFRRFFPVAKVIRAWIEGERLGTLKSFRFLEGHTFSWPASSDSFFKRETAGGGVLIDSGAHALDLLLWWMGPVGELEYSDDAAGGVETNCVLKLKMRNGITGHVQLSRDWPLPNQYRFEFEKGWIVHTLGVVDSFRWGWHGDHIAQRAAFEVGFDRLPQTTAIASTVLECFELQLLNVIAAIQEREELTCPGSDSIMAVALIERCYNKRQVLRQPWLSEKEETRFKILCEGSK